MAYVLNPRILGGVVCYVAVMVLFIAAYRSGGALTLLYPTYASTFIFAAIIALLVYGTPITAVNILGMMFLVLGMVLMGRQDHCETASFLATAKYTVTRVFKPGSKP